MPKAATFCNDILALILNTTAIANIAQNNTTSPDTNFYFSLHTANPGTSDSQTTSEISYTGYSRVAVPRTTSGFAAPVRWRGGPGERQGLPGEHGRHGRYRQPRRPWPSGVRCRQDALQRRREPADRRHLRHDPAHQRHDDNHHRDLRPSRNSGGRNRMARKAFSKPAAGSRQRRPSAPMSQRIAMGDDQPRGE